MALAAKVQIDAPFEIDNIIDFATVSADHPGWGHRELQNGTASQQADRVYAKTITLAASATQDIDLSGALLDPSGGTAVFAKVKAIVVRARDGNTNNVVLSPAPTNGFVGPFGAATHTIAIQPGGRAGFLAPGAGWTVTAATGELLRVANGAGGTPVTLDIVIIGTSA